MAVTTSHLYNSQRPFLDASTGHSAGNSQSSAAIRMKRLLLRNEDIINDAVRDTAYNFTPTSKLYEYEAEPERRRAISGRAE